MILEGGAIDVNGAGALLTTESCLLNKNRNPNLSREEIEQRLRDYLGVRDILWLGDGIAGDDTDGHIDDLARFVSESTVVTVVEENRADENYEPLQKNLARLKAMNLLGRCYCELGMLDLAMKQLEEASKEILSMDAMKKEIVYNLGLVYERMGQREKSLNCMKQIYEVDYGYKDVATRVESSYEQNIRQS